MSVSEVCSIQTSASDLSVTSRLRTSRAADLNPGAILNELYRGFSTAGQK